MQDRVTYEFAVIRVVPQVEREEFINVGVLLYSKRKKYLGIKYKIDVDRLKAFSDQIDLEVVQDYLEAWKSICEGGTKGGAIGQFEMGSRFRWLSASKSTIIQCSKTHPGLCRDPKKALEQNFKRYV